ncbi:MAG: hypothetical protein ABJ081_07025 [Hyphomicrobiales bacterium]
MIIHLRIEKNSCRTWLLHLIGQLKKRSLYDVRLDVVAPSVPLSKELQSLLNLEKMLVHRGIKNGADTCTFEALSLQESTLEKPDIIIDLTSSQRANNKARTLKPRYNGVAGEEALVAFLLASGTPEITIEDVSAERMLAKGTASLEAAQGIGGAMEAVYSRVSILLLRVLDGVEDDHSAGDYESMAAISNAKVAKHIVRSLGANAARAIYNLTCYPSHWRIGWRFVDGDGVMERQNLGGTPWKVLPHPIDHFYADPVPFEWQGKHYLFFEDLDQKTGKGVIAVVPFDESGPSGPVQVVLEETGHLSYPFLIEQDGEIWMIPETSYNNDIAIYRAVDFPYKWERHQTLISDVEAADATIVEHQGAWWMFAVTREGIGGYSDTLCLYKADSLFGPWVPHKNNPVLVDHQTARPAGNIVMKDGALWRPVQNCAGGYGAALGLAEITKLDDEGFDQSIAQVVYPQKPAWPGRKLHTLNRAGRLEVIDGCIYRPKLKWAANLADRYYKAS